MGWELEGTARMQPSILTGTHLECVKAAAHLLRVESDLDRLSMASSPGAHLPSALLGGVRTLVHPDDVPRCVPLQGLRPYSANRNGCRAVGTVFRCCAT